MGTTQVAPGIFEELADLFASRPTREHILKYHPSQVLQERARELLAKQGEGRLTQDEQRQLDAFLHAELFMRIVKAKFRAQKALQS